MAFTKTSSEAASPAAGRAPSSAGPLFGMYALLATTLACIGASAGDLLFSDDHALSIPLDRVVNKCLFRFPIRNYASLQQFDLCAEGVYRSEGLFVIGAAVAVPLLAVGLVLIVPWLDRRRLARVVRFTDIPGLIARFESLCDEARLAGHRRPQLIVAGVGQAFTAALPGGRPLVVIPAKVALAWRDPRSFDPVVLHELAHVRARDVSWVSSVRGIAWITIPVVALASVPEFLEGGATQIQRTLLIQAGVFVAATLLVAAGLLRGREIDADRLAARWLGSPDALQSLLGSAETQVGAGLPRTSQRWLWPLARHPSLAARILALRDPLGTRDAGFVYALVTGTVAAMAMNTCFYVTWTLSQVDAGWLPARVSAGAGGLLLGLGLTPAFLRRAARARHGGVSADWWQPVAGVALGLLLGSFVTPSTQHGATLSFLVLHDFAGVTIALLLACAGAGMAMLAAGLASLVAARGPYTRLSWVTVWVTVVICCCTAAALLPVPSFALDGTERLYLAFLLPQDKWRWLILLYPITVIALTTRIWSRHGHDVVRETASPQREWASTAQGLERQGRAAVALVVTPVCAAVVAAALFLTHVHPGVRLPAVTLNLMAQETWWVCALTGWIVLVILALAGGVAGLSRACVSAWLATLLVGVERAVYGSFLVNWHYFRLLPSLTITPSVWLFYLALPTSCLAMLGSRSPAVPKSSWLVPAIATAGAAAATVYVVVGIPGLFVPLVPPPLVPFRHVSRPLITADSGQKLTDAGTRAVIGKVGAALPSTWIHDDTKLRDGSLGHLAISPHACLPLAGEEYLHVLARPLDRAQGRYRTNSGVTIIGGESLSVQVDSYARPVPSSLFIKANRDLRACHQFVVIDSRGSIFFATHGIRMPSIGVGVSEWRVDDSFSLNSEGSATAMLLVSVGHNLIVIYQQSNAAGTVPPPDDTAIDDALTAAVNALGHRS